MADFNAIEEVLADFPWLQELGPDIYNLIVDLVISDVPPAAIAEQVRQTDVYKTRFGGMELRRAKGLGAITEREYMAIQDQYRNLLRDYGVWSFFGTSPTEWNSLAAGFIGTDVSPLEISRRLDEGYAAVVDAAPVVGEAFRLFYGVEPTPNALLLYFLDTDRGSQEIEQQLMTTMVGAEALRYGLNITRTRAELLAKSGVTGQIARTGFADIAREQPLLEQLAKIHRFSPLSQEDLEQLFFHEDPEILGQRRRIFETSLAAFQGPTARQSRTGGLLDLVDLRRTF